MLDHVGIGVSDLERSKAFYIAALEPLGIELMMERPGVAGLGRDRNPFFWIAESYAGPVHVSFRAPDRATVDAFHAAALAAGGKDNGPPGVREIYHPTYYGAFAYDFDGHNVEAVCHKPPD